MSKFGESTTATGSLTRLLMSGAVGDYVGARGKRRLRRSSTSSTTSSATNLTLILNIQRF